MILTIVILLGLLAAQAATPESAILDRYVRAIGGGDALRAVTTRVVQGRFDNGRGLNTVFRTIEKAPNKRVTLIGSHPIDASEGSGRGFEGEAGWDKSFVGTGLRTVEGQELADVAREADMLRPLHLNAACAALTVEATTSQATVLRCQHANGRVERLQFDSTSGLLIRQESELANQRGVIAVSFEDYRRVDAMRIPFRTRIDLPGGGVVTYTTDRVEQNVPVDDAVFARPRR